jgi:hypothetical protein
MRARRIRAGRAPGGIVVRFHDATTGELVTESILDADSDARVAEQANDAYEAIAAAAAVDVTMSVYDGDTGEPMSLRPSLAEALFLAGLIDGIISGDLDGS